MNSILVEGALSSSQPNNTSARLFVSWQNPQTRAILPVACLERSSDGTGSQYRFNYLSSASKVPGFQPFVGFSDLDQTYESQELFPFFENRLMPTGRSDYPDFLRSLGLDQNAEPFEVLARSEGRRETDTVEVFPEPVVSDGRAYCKFLVRGIRHVPGAQDAIDRLTVGDQLCVMFDPQNEADTLAVMLRTGGYELVGYVPRFLTSVIHDHLPADPQLADVKVSVTHIGERGGSVHLRLLCDLDLPWQNGMQVLSGPDYL